MFNILIIDDEVRVINNLKRAFRHIENFRIFDALDGDLALEIIKSQNIDLMIVDYLLGPPYQGDELIRLIRNEKFMAGKYKNLPVILMTGTIGKDEITLQMVSLNVDWHLKKNGVATLIEKALTVLDPANLSVHVEEALDDPHYDYDGVPWYEFVKPAVKSIRLEQCPINQADVAVIVATNVEFDQVTRLFTPLKHKRYLYKVPHELETYFVGRFGAFNSVLVKCEMGSVGAQSSLLTARSLIAVWKPKVIVMVGIAFGRDRVKYLPGDVLVASVVIPYEKERISVDEDIFKGPIPATGLLLQNRFSNAVGWEFDRPDGTHVSVHSGALLSGEKLVDDPVFKKELLDKHPQAIGGEMEAAGLYASAARKKLDWIVVKGVADWGDGKKHKKYQKLAAAASCSLAHFVFSDPNSLEGIEPLC